MGEEVSGRAKMELEGEGGGEEGEGECKVLEGVVLMVAKKLLNISQDLHRVVVDLGGEVAWQFSARVTHFVFQGKQNDLTKEFRVAKDGGCSIVSPDWLYMCRDERERVQESTFPHTFNPRLKLDMTETSSMSSTRTRTRNTSKSHKSKVIQQQQIDETNMEEEDTPDMTADDTTPPPTDTMKVTAEVSADLAVMENMLDSVSDTPVPARKALRTVLTTQENTGHTPTQAERKAGQEKESQVLWVDPQEEVDRKILAEQLNALETQDLGMESMGSMNVENLTAMMEEKENMKNKPKVFMVSGWTENEPNVEEAVARLGGSISGEGHYDPTSTHMLAVKVSRSEKMLGSVAAGNWVLHHTYVSASIEAGQWLDERKYEWGNMENKFIKDKEGMEYKLANAARKWRLGASISEGAFSGMRFILHMPDNKKGPFSRLVRAGGGEVLPAKTPYSNTPGATHLLTETKYIGEGQVDFAGLATRGVPVMKPIYLNDFLTTDPPPSVEQFLLDEFKPHWDSKKRSRISTDTPTNAYKKTKSVFGNVL
jgi:topoisomerase (DNA) II binding protein 1